MVMTVYTTNKVNSRDLMGAQRQVVRALQGDGRRVSVSNIGELVGFGGSQKAKGFQLKTGNGMDYQAMETALKTLGGAGYSVAMAPGNYL